MLRDVDRKNKGQPEGNWWQGCLATRLNPLLMFQIIFNTSYQGCTQLSQPVLSLQISSHAHFIFDVLFPNHNQFVIQGRQS